MDSLILSILALATSVLRVSVWLTILVMIFLPLERLFAVRPLRVFRRGIGTDLGYYFLNSLMTSVLLSLPIGLLAWVARHAVPGQVIATMAALPLWGRLLAGMVAGEFGYYWGHRWSHEVPFLWRFHAIHHSYEEVDFLVNTRAHPVDMVFGRFCGFVPMFLLGLGGPAEASGSLVPILVTLIGTVWGFFIHANLRWRFGPLEWLISTPAFHHWHHTKADPVDRNYSSTLPWLDWLFGTFYLPPGAWPVSYGIREPLPDTLGTQLVYPFFPAPATEPGAASPATAPLEVTTPSQ